MTKTAVVGVPSQSGEVPNIERKATLTGPLYDNTPRTTNESATPDTR